MYDWRRMSESEREVELGLRQAQHRPWHAPPHQYLVAHGYYHVTAACFEHQPYIGHSAERLDAFASSLLDATTLIGSEVRAWCLLPNHYHLLVQTSNLKTLLLGLGRVHGRTARLWNLEDHKLHRKVFYRSSDRVIRSLRHYWATVNYIHHNPVKHQYVKQWTAWRWSSATEYLTQIGREKARHIWNQYPILDYGATWDVA